MKLSRHAKNNQKLYKISEKDIIETIEAPDFTDSEKNKSISIKKFPGKYLEYPLKVVYEKIGHEIMVITAYPLKKKHWR